MGGFSPGGVLLVKRAVFIHVFTCAGQFSRMIRMNPDERNRYITELVGERFAALLLFARQWNHPGPEDVVQNAFLKLMQQRPLPRDPIAWLYAVVRNLSNNELRSQKRRKNREMQRVSQNTNFHGPENPEQEQLLHALETLDLEFREIITSKIWGKLSFDQIAEVLGSSRSSVHRKYRQGLALLHERLDAPCRNTE